MSYSCEYVFTLYIPSSFSLLGSHSNQDKCINLFLILRSFQCSRISNCFCCHYGVSCAVLHKNNLTVVYNEILEFQSKTADKDVIPVSCQLEFQNIPWIIFSLQLLLGWTSFSPHQENSKILVYNRNVKSFKLFNFQGP